MNYPIQKSDIENAIRRDPYRKAGLDTLIKRQKLSGTERRMAKRATFRTLVIFPDQPIEPAVKLVLKLQSLPLVKVIRRQEQFARRASTAKYLLLKMADKSPFRPGMEEAQRGWIGAFRQATAEIKARGLAATGKLASE